MGKSDCKHLLEKPVLYDKLILYYCTFEGLFGSSVDEGRRQEVCEKCEKYE